MSPASDVEPSVPPSAPGAPGGRGPVDLRVAPKPRRPVRRLTLVVLGLSAAVSLLAAAQFPPELRYVFSPEEALPAGALQRMPLGGELANRLVRADGALAASGLRYERFGVPGSHWLVPAAGRSDLWVDLSVPDERASGVPFIPPGAFVGRLASLDEAGARYRLLQRTASGLGLDMPPDAWVLIDGELPADARWTLGAFALFLAFAFFSVAALFHLVRRVPAR